MNELPISSALLLDTVSEAVAQGSSVIVAGTGDSMLPFIRPETDKLLLAPLPSRALLPGDVVLYRRPGGQAVIHRVFRVHDGCCDMLGDHQLWVEQDVPRSAMVAYVKAVLRPEGSYDCDTAAARRRACREMRRRLRPKRTRTLRRYAHAAGRRAARLAGKIKELL